MQPKSARRSKRWDERVLQGLAHLLALGAAHWGKNFDTQMLTNDMFVVANLAVFNHYYLRAVGRKVL